MVSIETSLSGISRMKFFVVYLMKEFYHWLVDVLDCCGLFLVKEWAFEPKIVVLFLEMT